ncbi:MAG: formate/nitrite transporter family protein [Lachnospiraceae bacterium]|nr:formate/nitrite transporter family protein [Lachnospiraceae bacterium]
MLKNVFSGILAGLLVSLGGGVFLSTSDKVVGAVGFTIGLLAVCFYGANLYTGRVGYLFDRKKGAVAELFSGLLGNVIGSVLVGLALMSLKADAARELCGFKLEQPAGETLIRAIFCGMLVYIAVNLFRDKKTVLGIVIGIPVFILSGYEHSIADIFYFAAAGLFSGKALLFLLIVLVGNSIGALLFDRILFYAGLKK